MNFENIVSAIEAFTGVSAVKTTNGYQTVCPIHGDRDRNLSLSDGDDRVLMHCHSHGCDPKSIMESIGLSISDVYYQSLSREQNQKRAVFVNKAKILKSLISEIGIIALCVNDLIKDKQISAEDKERFKIAINRVGAGLNHVEGML